MSAVETKACSWCGETKPVDSFPVWMSRNGRPRVTAHCRQCNSARKTYSADRYRAYVARKRAENIDAVREAARLKQARRRATAHGTLRNRIASRLRHGVRFSKGRDRTFEVLGYTLAELKSHLERQFLKGMGWHNMSEWHIDHIVPLSSFTITGPDDPELRRAWALTNLRPLWATQNMRKGARMESLL